MINSLWTPQFFAADENLYDLFFVVVESPQGSKLNESFKLGKDGDLKKTPRWCFPLKFESDE